MSYVSTLNITGYNITVTLWVVPQGIRFQLDIVYSNGITTSDLRRVDNVMFFLDGEYVVSIYDIAFGGFPTNNYHTAEVITVTSTHTITRGHLRLGLLNDKSRGSRTLTIRFTDATSTNATIGFTNTVIDLNSQYTNTKFITRALFNASPNELQATPGLLAQIKTAGVTHLISGLVYGGYTIYNDWYINSIENKLRPILDYCLNNNMYLLGAGDDWLRTGDERTWLLNTSWTAQAIQQAAYISQSYGGILNKVDTVDEVGNPPGSFDPVTDPYAKYVSNWRQNSDIGIGWPMAGTETIYPTGWEKPLWANYASRYVASYDFRPGRADGLTIYQVEAEYNRIRRDFNNTGTSATLPIGWDLIVELECSGVFYTKGISGGDYNPAGDILQNPAVRPERIIASAWIGIVYGATGLKAYAYDQQEWVQGRAAVPIGTQDLQTGTKPGDARWTALSTAFNSVAKYEKQILSNTMKYTRSLPWLIGQNGNIKIAINISEHAQSYPLGKGGVLINVNTDENGIAYNGDSVTAGSVIINA
jgi:hypothetical protein